MLGGSFLAFRLLVRTLCEMAQFKIYYLVALFSKSGGLLR